MKVLVGTDGMEGVFGGQLLQRLVDNTSQPWKEWRLDVIALGMANHPYKGVHRTDVGKQRSYRLLLRVRDQRPFGVSIWFWNERNLGEKG